MSTAPVTDEREHFTALKALLDPVLGNDPVTSAGRTYDYGKVPGFDNVPGNQPNAFVVLSVERTFIPGARIHATRSGWRISVRYVGRSVDEARLMAERATQALELPARLVVDGHTATPIQHESTQAIAPDSSYSGRFSGYSLLTYVL